MQRQVAADLTELEDNAGSYTPGVTREEVESAVMQLKKWKSSRRQDSGRVVEEWRKCSN